MIFFCHRGNAPDLYLFGFLGSTTIQWIFLPKTFCCRKMSSNEISPFPPAISYTQRFLSCVACIFCWKKLVANHFANILALAWRDPNCSARVNGSCNDPMWTVALFPYVAHVWSLRRFSLFCMYFCLASWLAIWR